MYANVTGKRHVAIDTGFKQTERSIFSTLF